MKTRKLDHLKFAFSLIILFNLLTGCQSSFESKIQQKIISDSKTHYKVIFPLKDLTNFDWDKFYAFDSNCDQKVINKALGFEYPYYKESSKTLVFIQNGKIVHHEENPVTKNGSKDVVVSFVHPDSIQYFRCTFGNSYIRVEGSEKTNSYKLYPLL
jgi:hypothetical protein